jgi:hypothetical protein
MRATGNWSMATRATKRNTLDEDCSETGSGLRGREIDVVVGQAQIRRRVSRGGWPLKPSSPETIRRRSAGNSPVRRQLTEKLARYIGYALYSKVIMPMFWHGLTAIANTSWVCG